jgi:hypothetical protein
VSISDFFSVFRGQLPAEFRLSHFFARLARDYSFGGGGCHG